MKKFTLTLLSVTALSLSLFGLLGTEDQSHETSERGVFPKSSSYEII